MHVACLACSSITVLRPHACEHVPLTSTELRPHAYYMQSTLFMVCDGHGGVAAASFVAARLHKLLQVRQMLPIRGYRALECTCAAGAWMLRVVDLPLVNETGD